MKKRNISLDIMRIIAMWLIILLHSIDHSGLYEQLIPGTYLSYIEEFLYAITQISVNCFVLISGYFLVDSKFKINKLLRLWVEVVFYSLTIKIILMILGVIPFSITSLISCILPIVTGRYWFVTIYFGMYLLSPFLNVGIRAMTKKQFKLLLGIFCILFSVLISIHPAFKGMNSGGGWGIVWFIVLYYTAAYLKLYYIPDGKIKSILFFFGSILVMIGGLIIGQELEISALLSIVKNWWRYDSVPVYVASCAFFIIFLNCQFTVSERMNHYIILISGTTFGIYLFHAHANICTEQMWQMSGILNNGICWWLPFVQIMIVTAIFFICSLIDLFRKKVFRLFGIYNGIEKISNWMEMVISNYED